MAVTAGVIIIFDGQQISAGADVQLKSLEREVGVSGRIEALDLLLSLAGTSADGLGDGDARCDG